MSSARARGSAGDAGRQTPAPAPTAAARGVRIQPAEGAGAARAERTQVGRRDNRAAVAERQQRLVLVSVLLLSLSSVIRVWVIR